MSLAQTFYSSSDSREGEKEKGRKEGKKGRKRGHLHTSAYVYVYRMKVPTLYTSLLTLIDTFSVNAQSENVRKNRYVNALPYDHARVALNALSNVNGSDYINASTIVRHTAAYFVSRKNTRFITIFVCPTFQTDHDPRNPAYIATQGPLENTVCDFWQMLWEQGCNIVVMLTRIIENDTSMCYRYWPSEGVDLYNIYEVRNLEAGHSADRGPFLTEWPLSQKYLRIYVSLHRAVL